MNADEVRKLKDKGAQLFAKARFEDALEAYRAAAAMAPGDLTIRQKMAELLQRLGRREAVSAFEWLANAYAREGHLLRAIAACRVVLQLDPAHQRTQGMLAELNQQRRAVEAPAQAQPLQAAAPVTPPTSATTPGASPAPAPIPLFSSLGQEEFVAVLESMDVRRFEPGETIVREGEVGTTMYAIVEGRVDVLRGADGGERKKVAEMGEGDFFGEVALITDAPRLATIAAAEACTLLEFSRARMEEIVGRHPRVGEVMQAFYRERLLANVLRSNPLFASLPEPSREALSRAFVLKKAEPGEVLLRHGDPGDGLYILLRGRCTALHQKEDGSSEPYPPMTEGAVFGEISLLLARAVSATVRADTSCSLLWLARADFDRLVRSQAAFKSELVQTGFERLQRTARLNRI